MATGHYKLVSVFSCQVSGVRNYSGRCQTLSVLDFQKTFSIFPDTQNLTTETYLRPAASNGINYTIVFKDDTAFK
jgi:hypothetical protein